MTKQGLIKAPKESNTLPSGWCVSVLGKILPLTYGKGLPARDRKQSGSIPVYGSSGVVGRHDEALTSGPTIIVGRKGSAGEVHFSREACWPIDTVYFIDRFDVLNAEFSAYLLRSLRLARLDQSTAIPSLSRDNYNSVSVPVPPANEQGRIVAKLDELFSRIEKGEENLKRVQALVKQYRQSVLRAAVTGELTRDWREKHGGKGETGADLLQGILTARRAAWEAAELEKIEAKGKLPKDDKWKRKYKEPEPPDTSDLPELPGGWVWCSLDCLIYEIKTGPFGSLLHKDDYVDGGTPLVNPINIEDRRILPNRNVAVDDHTLIRLKKYLLRENDIVMARRGEMGRCAPVTESEGGWLCGTGSLIMRPTAAVEVGFLSMSISAGSSRRFLEDNSVGTTMKNLNQGALRRLPIAVSSRAEQLAVIDRVGEEETRAEALMQWAQEQIYQSNVLQQSVLRAAFLGKLVTQDPSYDPASVLLERIAEERAASRAENPKRERRKKQTKSHQDYSLERR